jgi:hypothetical protein
VLFEIRTKTSLEGLVALVYILVSLHGDVRIEKLGGIFRLPGKWALKVAMILMMMMIIVMKKRGLGAVNKCLVASPVSSRTLSKTTSSHHLPVHGLIEVTSLTAMRHSATMSKFK